MLALLKVSIFIFFSHMGFVLFFVSTNGSLFLSDTLLKETDDFRSSRNSTKMLFFLLVVFTLFTAASTADFLLLVTVNL